MKMTISFKHPAHLTSNPRIQIAFTEIVINMDLDQVIDSLKVPAHISKDVLKHAATGLLGLELIRLQSGK